MSKTHVPLDQVRDNPHQPRLDIGDVEALAETILQHGLRQLPEARLVVDGTQPSYSSYTYAQDQTWYLEEDEMAVVELASGHRRVEAIRQLNLDDTVTDGNLRDVGLTPGYVPVDLQRLSDEEMLDLLTIENAQRESLSPIEEARLIAEMVDAGRDAAQIAERFGKSPSWVSNRKRLTTLPVYVQEHVHDGDISVRQGVALATAFAVEEEHPGLAERVNVDLKPGTMVEKAKRGDLTSDDIRDLTNELVDVVERVEESKQDHKQDSGSTTETNEPRQNRAEAETDDVETDASTRPQEDFRSNDGGGPESSPSQDSASRPSVDEEEREESAGKAGAVSGVPSPLSDSNTGHSAHLPMVIDAVEADGHDWRLQSLDEGHYQGTVQNGGNAHIAEGATPTGALQSAWHSAQDVPADQIGNVNKSDIDCLLSADGTEMWDEQAAKEASIASLLVAHRVAGERQETWRTALIAEAVEERAGRVDRDEVPEDVLEEVQAEVERRLEPVEA